MASFSTSDELLKKVEKRKQLEKEQTHIGWYFWLLSEYPVLVLFLCSVIIGVFTAVGVVYTTIPDFSDPSKGFEVRGTVLADKLVAWHKLRDSTGYNLSLSNYPYTYLEMKAKTKESTQSNKANRRKRSLPPPLYNHSTQSWNFKVNGYFCHNPKSNFANYIFKLKDGSGVNSLWSVQGLLSICRSQQRLLVDRKYEEVCHKQSKEMCCPVMSLPNYVAHLAGLSVCENITQASVSKVGQILATCAPYYCNNTLSNSCWNFKSNRTNCRGIPKKCIKNNAIYHIFHTFFEHKLICSEAFPSNIKLQRSAVFLPTPKHKRLLPIYYDNFDHERSDQVVEIFAIDFGIKEEVFRRTLFSDTVYPLCAMAAVGIVIYLYTDSFFITIMSFVSTASAMFISYFFYTIVFDFKYFPFINLASLLVMVGLSADGVLVFFSAWKSYKKDDEIKLSLAGKGEHQPFLERVGVVMKATMRHVSWSLFVTGFTTAAAFFANYASQVTAIKCFGVYTGLTVLSNLFLSLTWLPASIVFHHKYLNCNVSTCFSSCLKFVLFRCLSTYWLNFRHFISDWCRIFFDQIQVLIIVRLRFIWTSVFMALAIGGIYVVVVKPGLHLPQTKTYFQYFRPSHPFEVYTTQVSQDFAFQNVTEYLPVRIVFGVWPTDTGDYRDPDSTGSLRFQRNFNVSSRTSQRWLLKFCKKMRNSSYYRPVDQQTAYTMCFIETFKEWMESQDCVLDNLNCCRQKKFPYHPVIFNHCLKEAIHRIYVRPEIRLNKWTPGPRFDLKDTIRAVIVEFSSNVSSTSSFEEISRFYKNVEDFLKPELEKAPTGLSNAWFVSDLDFFALQLGLFNGTIASVGWSILVALLVILVTSRNLLISIFASATIAGIIFVTVGSLVLVGWELNVLESITISIAVGLSVDFTAHYAIAYVIATPNDDRQRRVEFSASRMGPAITLAAFTTFLAGVGMMPAHVLVYTQFGVFLALIMVISWLYSSYFFLAVLSIMGPQGRCCDLCCCKCDSIADGDEHTTTIMTETSTCTPSTSYHNDRSTAI